MSKSRKEIWLIGIVSAGGLLLALIAGSLAYMSATAPLHPNPQDVPSVTKTAPSPQRADAVAQAREIVHAALLEQNLPGLSVAVGAGGDVVWAEGFGWADLEKHEPVSPDTLFRIGTASTALTSAAVGLLLEQGRLELDDAIQKHVPGFPRKEWPVTLRQVMAHVAGLRNDGGDESVLFAQKCARPVDALPYFAHSPLLFEPGTEYRPSRYGWIVVSAAVEAAAEEPFVLFMRSKIFGPLGMDHTGPDVEIPERVTSYFPRFAADPTWGQHLMRPLEYSCYAGSAAFLSTPSDMVRFGLAINAGTILQPATVQLLQTSQRLTTGRETGDGLGWDLDTVTLAGRQRRMVGRSGDVLGGTVASLLTFPELGLAVSVTSNISYADTFNVAVKIAEAFAEKP